MDPADVVVAQVLDLQLLPAGGTVGDVLELRALMLAAGAVLHAVEDLLVRVAAQSGTDDVVAVEDQTGAGRDGAGDDIGDKVRVGVAGDRVPHDIGADDIVRLQIGVDLQGAALVHLQNRQLLFRPAGDRTVVNEGAGHAGVDIGAEAVVDHVIA